MEKKNDQLRETVREIIIGIFACGILELLVCFLFVGGNPLEISMVKLKSMAGIFMGCMIAIGWFFHMEKSLREAMALGEKRAPLHIRKGYAFRMILAAVLLLLVALTDLIPILAVLAGLLTLKPAAYLQPLFHRYLLKFQRKEEMG